MIDNLEQVLWPDHCLQGKEGARLVSGFDDRPVEAIFRKGTNPRIDSYSGFFDNGRKNLPGWVIICGDAQCDRFIFAGWPLNSAFFIRRLTPLSLALRPTISRMLRVP